MVEFREPDRSKHTISLEGEISAGGLPDNNECAAIHVEKPNVQQDEYSPESRLVPDSLIGSVFANKYKIISRLGQGSMATVYEGQDLSNNQQVAIKLLHSHLTSFPEVVARFEQECKSTKLIAHPNVVAVYDSDISNGQPYLVMELIEGKSLASLIRSSGCIEPKILLNICIQVCCALYAAHEKGIIHRDLKPANILLCEKPDGSMQVKLVDFGIAHILPNLGETHFRVTQTGEFLGSLLYMSPEQCLEQDIDKRSDVYSLGCILYEGLTGTPPLAGRTAFETINKHLSVAPRPISECSPNVKCPDGMEDVILKALNKSPADRYQSVDALQRELELLSRGQLPIARAKRADKNTKLLVVCLSIMAIVATILVIYWRAPQPVSSPVSRPIRMTPVVSSTPAPGNVPEDDARYRIGKHIGKTIDEEEKVLLSPSKDDYARFANFLRSPNTGLIRLMPREKYDGKLRIRGGGAYYSFVRRDQEYNYGSDISLESNEFCVGFAGGDFGFFTSLGDRSLESVDINTPGVPFLANYQSAHRSTSPVIQDGDFSYSSRIAAQDNTTYVVRSIMPEHSDVLVAFRTVRRDTDGSAIVLWKLLKIYQIPPWPS